MSIAVIISFIASVLGIFASYLLLVRSSSQPSAAHKLLGLIIFSFSWLLIVTTLNFSGISIAFPHVFQTGLPLCLIIPPACYLYVRSFLKSRKPKVISLVHFVPALLLFLNLPPFFLQGAEKIYRIDTQRVY